MAVSETKPDSPRDRSRRSFVNLFLASGALGLMGAIVYPLIRFVLPPEQPEAATSRVVAAKVGELTPNSAKIFPFGKEPAILILTVSGEYRAFTAICTHLDCTVQYRKDLKHIWCACHNGHYDLNGINIAGPPPSPLTAYNVAVSGDQIVVSKV